MKKVILTPFVLVVLLLANATAQNFDFKWSPVFTIQYKGEENKKIIHATADELIVLRKAENALPQNYYYEVVKYDQNLNEAYKVKVSPKYGTTANNQSLIDVLYNNGKVIVLYHHFVKEEGETKVEYVEVSTKGDLSALQVIGTVKTEKYSETPEFKAAISPDGTKLGVFAKLDHEKNTNEKWKVWAFNTADTKEILVKDVELDIESERSTYNEFFINNTGNAQIFKRWFVKKEADHYSVFTISANADMVKTDLDLGGHEIANRKIFFNTQGQLAVCGLYHDKGKSWSPFKGTFLVSVDAAGAVQTTTMEYFGKMVLELVYPKSKRADKEDEHIMDYKMLNVIEEESGDITLVIEKLTEFTSTIQGSTDPFARDYNRTQSKVIAIRLNSKGEKIWAQAYDKKQEYKTEEQEKYWGGVATTVKNGEVYFLFNFINLPLLPHPKYKILGASGWTDGNKKKHFVFEEFGNRAHYATFATGFDAKGTQLFTGDAGYENSVALIEMYKGATYAVTFNSAFYASAKNTMYLFMEMPVGVKKGGTKWQICKVSLN